MGDANFKNDKAAYSKLWNEIRLYHDFRYRIRLRDAANLIGFSKFPYGWKWTEFPPNKPTDILPYQAKSLKLTKGKSEQLDMPNEEGLAYADEGILYRRIRVRRYLRRYVTRGEIRSFLEQEAIDHEGRTEPYRKPKGLDFERLNIERSIIGKQNHWQTKITIDAIQLIDILMNEETRGRPSKSDLGEIERKMRQLIELGQVEKLSQLVNTIMESPSFADGTNEPREQTVKDKVAELNEEYKFAK